MRETRLLRSIKYVTIVTFCFIAVKTANAQTPVPSAKQQIEAAVSAAPQSMRSQAKVYGYDQQGNWTTLRKGSNDLICIADDPARSKFHVACYFDELEPFMKRGRELRAKGKSHQQVDEIRGEEIKNGTLEMPKKPMALYNLSGPEDGFNYKTGTLENANPLYVVYIPYATQESTGLSASPMAPGAPWLMEVGLPWAHIMIPGRPQGKNAEN